MKSGRTKAVKKGTDMPLPEGKRKSLYGEYTLIISDKYRKEGGFAKGFPEGGGGEKIIRGYQ